VSAATPGRNVRGGGAMRLRGLVRKEFLQIRRDPSSIAIAFLMPVILLLLFGYGVSLDADHVPIAVVVDQPTADTADFTASIERTKYFDAIGLPTMADAEDALMAGRVNGIVHLQGDFGRRLRSSDGAPIQVIVNGVDANTGRIIIGYVQAPGRPGWSARRVHAARTWHSPWRSSSACGSTARCAAATSSCRG